METIKKNWLGWLISALIAFLTVILTASLANNSQDQFDLKVKVDSKVDKKEYEKHCDENRLDFQKIQDFQAIYLKENNEILNKLVEQNAKMSTDIEWIKRKIQ